MGSDITRNSKVSESQRCLGCKVPRCKDACPVGCDIPNFLHLVALGQQEKAVELIGHPFGEICGHVCPHDETCFGNCVLSKNGQAVQMGTVESAVFAECPYKVERKGNSAMLKVAVVGGGVAGITFAVKMYEQGAHVTVYEKDELLSTLKLIPSFRLPRKAIERIEREIGGKFAVVKQDVTSQVFDRLQQQYDIVYLATGASAPYRLDIVGQELATPYDKFLKTTKFDGEVVVIGGGNTAMDCARLAKRNGCKATVAYRRDRNDMPAFAKEIVQAQNEGVDFVFNVAPVKLERKDGRLLLTVAKTVSEGRAKLTVTDEKSQIVCDTVVSALGSGFDKSIFGEKLLGDDLKHPLDKVYVGGDAVGGKIVAKAVADAIQATKVILLQNNEL